MTLRQRRACRSCTGMAAGNARWRAGRLRPATVKGLKSVKNVPNLRWEESTRVAGHSRQEPNVNMRLWMPLMAALAGAPGWASAQAEVMGCLVEPDRVADVGSQSVGVLEHLMVERGDKVVAGQVLARLAAQVERASVSVAQARSSAEAEVSQAVAAYQLAQRKLERARDLLKQEFVSSQAVDQAEAEARVAEQRVVQAQESQHVAQREYRLSAAQLSQRDVRSPFEGVVIERYRTEGERIEREPVVRVARIDPLRVEAIVPASQFGTIGVGQQAIVRTELAGFDAMHAKVVLVDRVIDPASNSFRVRLTLPNPDHRIPPGLRCKLDFAARVPAATSAAELSKPAARLAPASARPSGVAAVERVRAPLASRLPSHGAVPAFPMERPAPRSGLRGILPMLNLPPARALNPAPDSAAPGPRTPMPSVKGPTDLRLSMSLTLPEETQATPPSGERLQLALR